MPRAPRALRWRSAKVDGGPAISLGDASSRQSRLKRWTRSKPGKPKLLRYGKGSPFLDIRLPCGSGLDVFVQPMRDAALIQDMSERLERRQPFALRIDLATGAGQLQALAGGPLSISSRGEQLFPGLRACAALSYHRLKPDRGGISEMAACAGFEAEFYATDPGNYAQSCERP